MEGHAEIPIVNAVGRPMAQCPCFSVSLTQAQDRDYLDDDDDSEITLLDESSCDHCYSQSSLDTDPFPVEPLWLPRPRSTVMRMVGGTMPIVKVGQLSLQVSYACTDTGKASTGSRMTSSQSPMKGYRQSTIWSYPSVPNANTGTNKGIICSS